MQDLLKRRVIDKASQCMLVELSALGIHTLWSHVFEVNNAPFFCYPTVYEDGILLRSGNSLRNSKTLTERHNVKNRRSLQALNTNKNAREVRRSLHSVNTMEDSRLSRSTTRGSRSRRSQASDYVTSTIRITETASSSASMSSYTSSSKSSVLEPVRKTLIREFDDLEMEKGMKEIQNSNRKIKLYGTVVSERVFTYCKTIGQCIII